jgi:polyisoprenoid-binding protein YceI
MIKRFFTILAILFFIVPNIYAANYAVDVPHTQIHFSVAHLMVFKVRGNFTDFSGEIDIDTNKKTLVSAKATIDATSIDTRNKKRDDHLRSADFFDVAKYPEITFVSKNVSGHGENITVVGDLTIKGVTKEITLKGNFAGVAKDPWGNNRAGFAATGEVDRREFGLTWNKALEAGGVVVGDTITIGLEVESIAQK